jgi:hypothetical protein
MRFRGRGRELKAFLNQNKLNDICLTWSCAKPEPLLRFDKNRSKFSRVIKGPSFFKD